MPFALIQRRLEVPDVAALRRALAGREGWHATDADHLAADAFGILAKSLDEAAGHAMAAALAREGIPVDIVNEAELPALPVAKKLRRAECRPDVFIAHDPCDREIAVPWDRIRLVCAGEVRFSQFRPVIRNPEPVRSWDDEGPFDSRDTRIALNQEQRDWGWVADLVLVGGGIRFSLAADSFHPLGLGDRVTKDPGVNLQVFLADLLRLASDAVLNRGAFALREPGSAPGPRYPTRNAYQEEMIWLLWRMAVAETAGATTRPAAAS